MNSSSGTSGIRTKTNQNIQVYVRVRPLNTRERCIRSHEVVDVPSSKEMIVRQIPDSKMTKKFTFDRTFGQDSQQSEIYQFVVAPLIEEVLSGYNCTVFAYGQTGTGKTHTMIGTECPELRSSWDDETEIGIIPRALSHLFDELRMMEVEFSMRISYLELYNEELCDLLSSDDSTKIRIFDDSNKKGSVIIQGLEEIPVHSKNDVYKLLEKGKERRKTATTLMNAQSSRSHTVFSILVHIKENGMDGEEMLKIGKLNLVDLAGSENISKAGNEKGIRTRETVNINQSLLTLGRVITALVERTPHIPYRESKLTRLLQESLGGRTKTSIIATISPGHKDLEETLSTLEYAHRAKNIQNKPELNQKLTKKVVLKEYIEEIDRLKRDLVACRDKNGIYLAEDTYNDMQFKLENQNKELNEKILLMKALKEDLANKEKIFNEVSLHLIERTEELQKTEHVLTQKATELDQTKKVLTTTKRRYKEKKHLLESHIKTEQVLTKQATELVSVADVATSDTIQLQNTIDRRKIVDNEIKSVCDNLVHSIKNSFFEMNESLTDLQNKHICHSQLILDEINENIRGHKQFSSVAVSKLNSITDFHRDSVNEIQKYCSDFAKMSLERKDEYKESLRTLVDQISTEQGNFQLKLEKEVQDIRSYLEEQKNLIETSCSQLLTTFTANRDSVKSYSTTSIAQQISLQTQIEASLRSDIEKLCRTVSEQTSISESRNAALNEVEEAFAIFRSKMRALDMCQTTETSKLSQIANSIEETNREAAQNINVAISSVEEFKACNEQNLNEMHSLASALQSNMVDVIDKSNNSTINMKICMSEKTANHLEGLRNVTESIVSELEANIALQTELEKNILQTEQEHLKRCDGECGEVKSLVSAETDKLMQHQTQSMALHKSIKTNLCDYSNVYNAHISNCTDRLDKFQSNELKTYKPTGQTPAKKEFSYPRILAATSPHNRIIQRFRLENEWSDLDSTTTPNEDSEITLHDLSIDPLIANSTPKKIINDNRDTLKSFPKDFNIRTPQKSMSDEQQSFSQKNASQSFSRIEEEDKENIY